MFSGPGVCSFPVNELGSVGERELDIDLHSCRRFLFQLSRLILRQLSILGARQRELSA